MSDINEQEQVTKTTTVGKKCDYCGREERDLVIIDDNWFEFSIQHDAWGNDSVDSYESFDVCSPECFLALGLKEGNDNLEQYSDYDAEIADMPWKFFKKLAGLLK